MNFDFDDDHRELQRAARALLDDRCTLRDVRSVFEGPAPFDADLWDAGAAMGWMGLAVPEADGGLGLGYLELCLVAEELGRALAPIPLSSSVYLGIEALLLAGSPDQRARYLPRLAAGELIATLAVQERRDRVAGFDLQTRFEDGRLHGVKAPVPDGECAGLAVVVANGGSTLALVELDGEGVRREPLASLDPSRSLARLHFDGAAAEVLGADGDGRHLLDRLYDRAAVLFAFEQLGGAQRCLDLAVGYAKERYTFGRPIGSYQAVKHKLADVFVAVELARSNAYYGAWALSTGSDELAIAACLARISATEAFQAAAEEGLHVHGGIGFTWEHDAHLFLRRARLLAVELGAARRWKRTLVHRLAARP
ncbi:MAG: acyl-CoA/acyl-ACP dehydrogenase [Acidimicrobiales bacterium]|nr:acyl-CoA/acyl-ACP dehydrogenase [Acidimicrobiales bacterium]